MLVCLRCAEKGRGDHKRDGEARERHHRTSRRLQESAFCPRIAEDALRQDPSLVFGRPGQRKALQGTTRRLREIFCALFTSLIVFKKISEGKYCLFMFSPV